MPNWTDLLPEANAPTDGEKRCLSVAGRPIVLMRIDGQYHAIRDECPHAGLPLGEGELRGKVITCPYHGYAYNVTNGRNIDFPHDEPPCRTYPTRVEAGMIQADL